jgi:hypothetical protein
MAKLKGVATTVRVGGGDTASETDQPEGQGTQQAGNRDQSI